MLQGERVTLRAVRSDDLERYTKFRNDIEFNELAGYPTPGPVSTEQIRKQFDEHQVKQNPLDVWFAIEADGRFIGQCQLRDGSAIAQHAEVGITIGDREYWSRGYGREAVGLLLRYGFRHLNLQRIFLTTTSGNGRAIRCYLACGFIEEGRLRRHAWIAGGWEDEVLMGILREEWEARGA